MEQYLVELYLPRGGEAAVRAARAASGQVTMEGRHVRHLRTILVPQDEICFHLYEAQDADAVGEACLRAGIAYERIVRAVSIDGERSGAG